MTLAELVAATRDALDIDEVDEWHPEALIKVALNQSLVQSADRLCGTVARYRYMSVTTDLSAASGFDPDALTWPLPSNFRRPYKLVRNGCPIRYVEKLEDFSEFGRDGFRIIGQTLELTEGTDPTGLEVYWFYRPADMVADSDEPDFISGYDLFLAYRAAAIRAAKGSVGDPRNYESIAAGMWPDLVLAARNTPLPTNIRQTTTAIGEDWS